MTSFDALMQTPMVAILTRHFEKNEVLASPRVPDWGGRGLSFIEVPLNSPKTGCQYRLMQRPLRIGVIGAVTVIRPWRNDRSCRHGRKICVSPHRS